MPGTHETPPDAQRRGHAEPFTAESVTVRPANEATWEDVCAVFGTTGYHGRCQCQRFMVPGWVWRDTTQDERTTMLQQQTRCDEPAAPTTSGLVAYVDGEPAGWVAVRPRAAYPKLRTLRVPWSGRPEEDKDDDGVWAVTCFVVRTGFRGRGLMYHLAAATVEHARSRGARALEGYAMTTQQGKEITWGELHVGARQCFEEAGFHEVGRPSLRRAVMRIDFDR